MELYSNFFYIEIVIFKKLMNRVNKIHLISSAKQTVIIITLRQLETFTYIQKKKPESTLYTMQVNVLIT